MQTARIEAELETKKKKQRAWGGGREGILEDWKEKLRENGEEQEHEEGKMSHENEKENNDT